MRRLRLSANSVGNFSVFCVRVVWGCFGQAQGVFGLLEVLQKRGFVPQGDMGAVGIEFFGLGPFGGLCRCGDEDGERF